MMNDPFRLLFPEWQGYSVNQEVHRGAMHLCNHVKSPPSFREVPVPMDTHLPLKDGIIGKDASIQMLNYAQQLLLQSNPSSTFLIGGTCACELAPISFLNNRYDNDLAIFWFDAHGDLNTPESSPSHRLHGMPLRTLLGEGDRTILESLPRFLSKEQVALVGARDLDEGEWKYIKENQIPMFRPQNSNHMAELVDFAKSAGFNHAYIHFDLDVLEPLEFPHVIVQVENGLLIEQAIRGMQLIRENFEVVGSSIVEYCPREGGGLDELDRIMTEGLNVR